MVNKIFLGGFIVGIVMIIMGFAGQATMMLWNWLMPDIFGLTQIDFWQALGLLVLSTLLFWRSK